MTLKVLTVDDSKTIRMIVKKAFKPFDCELSEGENGVEGLALAAKIRPDLIVLDITMPVMNGIEMLEKLKGEPQLKDIPVIMLTAESGKDNVMKIVKMGVKDYMVKPFKGDELIERAQKIVKLEPKKAEKGGEDVLKKYFSENDDVHIMMLPNKIDGTVSAEIKAVLEPKVKEMTGAGANQLILDLSHLSKVDTSLIRVMLSIFNDFQKADINIRVVGTSSIAASFKDFAETSEVTVYKSTEEAKGAF
ncbi:MAG: response regulator [Thermodesulfobacteriota bacterium]|nr:response regulator [Thermodesulfobacteriota bacterium]